MEIDRWDKWEDLTISNDFMFSKVMRDKEKGKAEGMTKGIEEGIRKLVESLRKFGVDEKEIRVKVISKYGLREDELGRYLKQE